jgi:precorrin-2/cobalt-factor-2 C20-methyltransferase
MEGEVVLPLSEKADDASPYFSLILIGGEGRRP